MSENNFIEAMIERLNNLFNPIPDGETERPNNILVQEFPDNPKIYEFTHPIGSILVKSGKTTAQTGNLGVGQRSTAYQSNLYLLATSQYGEYGIYSLTQKILEELDGKHTGAGKPFFKLIGEAVFIDNGIDGYWERIITFTVPGAKIP